VRDDVDHLREVDHHQPAVVHKQVVWRQVAVREAVPGERVKRGDELVPEAGRELVAWPGLGQARGDGAVGVADELVRHVHREPCQRTNIRLPVPVT
jgi:hypothetical protein